MFTLLTGRDREDGREYFEKAQEFERFTTSETDAKRKADLLSQTAPRYR